MSDEPKPAPSKIIPNTFQTPNALASDHNSIMSVLTGNEVKCYLAIVRKIFGWGKQSDRIPKKQIMNITGLGEEAVETCMAALVGYGLVLRVAENHPKKNYGVEWALQTDDTRIRWDLLFSRVEERKDKRKKAASSYKGGEGGGGNATLPENTPHGGGVYQPNQKPLSIAIKQEEQGAQKPNLFKVYEQEIGAITPLIADALKDAEKEYPPGWVEEAIQIAVERNVRNWKYVRAVLEDCKAKKVSPKLNTKGKSNAKLNQSSSKSTAKPNAQPDQSVVDEINRRRREKGVR